MLTVGYGDVVPVTPLEKIYVIVMTLFACCVFGYTVNIIGTIFSEIA